ncbi:MAG: ATP-binding protein [Gammaproteobacteria bacterium]|nr:ATP-binding protein [Gammaproteobacteria bacterium]
MGDNFEMFPEGVAMGDAFINRVLERNTLIKRIKSNKHTVLMAPRRYGKTSLVMQVAHEMKIHSCAIDLLAAYDIDYVRDQIVEKVGRLVIALLPNLTKAREKLIYIFKQMKPEIILGAFGQKLKLHLTSSPLQDITDVLLKLDETAKHFKKHAVIFLDEFQQLSQLKNYHAIEASIRHAVERSANIAYVFSGSNRKLLAQMFGDSGRPLYRLCELIHIERMEKTVYVDHLRFLSKIKWKKIISDDVLERIFFYTELHPFYMNVLCQLLWDKNNIIVVEDVESAWHTYVKTQRQIISHDVMGLSANQRKILAALAKSPVKEMQSIDFVGPLKISTSSAQLSVEVLLKKDLICVNESAYHCVLDPAMKYYLDVILWESE